MKAPAVSNSASLSRMLIADTDLLPENSTKQVACPLQKPFYNGSACIECSAPSKLFNITSKTCTQCPDYYEFNSSSHKCEKKPPTVSNSASIKRLLIANADVFPDNSTKEVACSADKPFYNGR